MASEILWNSCDDLITKARGRFTEKSIVYTRRNRKKAPQTSINNDNIPVATTSAPENPSSAVLSGSANSIPTGTEVSTTITSAKTAVSPPPFAALSSLQDSEPALATKGKGNGSPFQSQHVHEQPQHGSLDSHENSLIQCPELPNAKGLLSPFSIEVQFEKILRDGNETLGSPQTPLVNVNGVGKPLVISSVDDRIRFNLSKATSKEDIKDFRKKLLGECEQVSRIFKELEAKELQLASYNTHISSSSVSNSSNYVISNGSGNGYSHLLSQRAQDKVADQRLLLRVNPEIGQLGRAELRHVGLLRMNSDMGAARNIESRPYSRQLSVTVMENNNRECEFIEKEKRTPKANQFYRNSEFLLGKDRLPPENNKRLKTSNGKKNAGEKEHDFGFGSRLEKSLNHMFKNCSSLLQRLMKHKHGWVFNEPVDVKGMGLVDYHDIIKHPMDLGTIKSRLSQKWYKSPLDFAEDVRLVFRNAMTYNPKGQDVHIMAEQMSQIFEERWAIIEAEYHSNWKHQMYHDRRLQAPVSRMVPRQNHYGSDVISLYVPPAQQLRAFDRHELAGAPMAIDPKAHRRHTGRTPVPKKPKAKDLNKRDMTYEEKQRLSNNLQGLPSEKLDAIIQIIKKSNTAVSQNEDEIEVDIDSVDPETLWELERFVTNYKKSLSKNKRKAELALQARTATNQNVVLAKSTPPVVNHIGSESAFENGTALPAEGDNRVNNGSRSSSSSSSSSDSGSSSSDSDSDSSSSEGSDAGHSPKSQNENNNEGLCA